MLKLIKKDDLLIIPWCLSIVFLSMGGAMNYLTYLVYPYDGAPFFTLGFKIPLFIIAVLFTIGFVLYLYFKKGIKINIPICVVLGVLFIFSLVAIYSNPDQINSTIIGQDGQAYAYSVNMSGNAKTIYVLENLQYLLLFYVLVVLTPKVINPRRNIFFPVLLVFIAVTIGILYSLFAEGWKIPQLFAHFKDDPYPYTWAAYFGHRNVFGVLLFITVVSITYMTVVLKKKWIILFNLIPLFVLPMTMSKTSIVLTVVFLFASLIFALVKVYKRNKKTGVISSSILAGLIIIVLLILFLTPISSYIYSMMSTGSTTIKSRAVIWNKTFQINQQNPIYMVFGRGFGAFSNILYQANEADVPCIINHNILVAHNMFVEEYGNGGIMYAIAFIAMVVYIFYLNIKYFIKKDKNIGFFTTLITTCFLLFFMVETIV